MRTKRRRRAKPNPSTRAIVFWTLAGIGAIAVIKAIV